MNAKTSSTAGRFKIYGLSIRQRLTLLICSLLLLTVVTLGWLSYIGVKKASLEVGKERLSTLTAQLSSMFGKSAVLINAATHTTASQPLIKTFLSNRGNADSVMALLDKLRLDSTWTEVDLLDSQGHTLLRSIERGQPVQININDVLGSFATAADTAVVGRIYQSRDSIYYPVIATITDNRKIRGFLVRWRLQTATPDALKQLSQLLGTNAQLYVGNRDGSLWTDLLRARESPPVDLRSGQAFFEYSRPETGNVLAALSPVTGTEWIILIEFSENVILTAPARFLKWLLMVGAVIVLVGFFVAWLVSRKITGPLAKLTHAASSVASGDYGASVPVETNDELAKLAIAFNAMTTEVRNAREGLEQKVRLRTQQLEAANSELEAFSYSVSHDLRAPLRSISSYAGILYEDYATKLDGEAIRLTNKIISNGKKMGQLIDDLLSFSHIVRKEIVRQTVDMDALAKSCVKELLGIQNGSNFKIEYESILPCSGDEALLRQVWFNLIDNAIKYSSKKEEPKIIIGCSTNGNIHTYFVKDNGAGFDMKYADKLFGVFQRLHSDKEFEGSGIGLALTKRIIERHKGKIYAEGNVGEGACFYFSLSK